MRDTKRGAAIATGLALMMGAAVLLASPFGGNAPPPSSLSVGGTVIAYPPDGGLRVTLGSDVVPVSGTVNAAVSGSVVAFPPDGGMRVTLGADVVPVSGAVSATVTSLPPITGVVIAYPPDGGMRVVLGSDVVNVAGPVTVSGAVSAAVTSLPAITGSVIAYPPDGGMRVRLDSDVVAVSGAVNATVVSLPPITGSVVAYPPDGGATVNILSSVRLDTVATTAPGTWLAVAGDSSGTILRVDSTGSTTSLSSSSLAAITAAAAERVCTYGTPVIVAALTTTPSAQPASPQTSRTEISLTNLQTDSRELWCRVSGTPSATNAIVIKAGVSLKLNVTDAQAVNCMCSQSTCRINFQEAACTHPAP